MTIPPHILETAYGKEGSEREAFLFGVIASLYAEAPVEVALPAEVKPLPAQCRRLLAYLMARAGMVATRDQILDHLASFRNFRPDSDKAANVYVCKLRKVLPASFGEIETVRHVGYRLNLAEGA